MQTTDLKQESDIYTHMITLSTWYCLNSMPVPANIPNTLHRDKSCPGFCHGGLELGHYSNSRKGKVVPAQAAKSYGRICVISTHILNLNTRRRSVVIIIPVTPPPRKNPWYPMHKMADEWAPKSLDNWLQIRQWCWATQLHYLPRIISAVCIVYLRHWVCLHNPHTCNPICTTHRNT